MRYHDGPDPELADRLGTSVASTGGPGSVPSRADSLLPSRHMQRSRAPTRDCPIARAPDRRLAVYVATCRGRDARLARVRIDRYLVPFFGMRRLRRVTGDDMRQYRLW